MVHAMARDNTYAVGFPEDPTSERKIGQNLNFALTASGLIIPVNIDSISGAIPAIETDHHRIHNGQGYNCTARFSAIAAAADLEILLVNPAMNYPHLRLYRFTATGGPCDTFLFSDTTVSSNGTVIASNNLNGNSSNVADMSIYHTPTITTDGTEIECDLLPIDGNKSSTQTVPIPLEHILKPSTNYLV